MKYFICLVILVVVSLTNNAFALSSKEGCENLKASNVYLGYPKSSIIKTDSRFGCTNAVVIDIYSDDPYPDLPVWSQPKDFPELWVDPNHKGLITYGDKKPTSKRACESIRIAAHAWDRTNGKAEYFGAKWRWGKWDSGFGVCRLPVIDLELDLNVSRFFVDYIKLAVTARKYKKPNDSKSGYYLKKVKLFSVHNTQIWWP